MRPSRVGILTVSDTAAQDSTADASGPAVRDLLLGAGGSFEVPKQDIVADNGLEIRSKVKEWCDEGLELVITAGGTGFGTRDVTPEALTPLIDRPAPGLVALMLTSSLAITPRAALSRPVAGVHVSTRSDGSSLHTLIITLPGSPKGATENLTALLSVLPHAIELARGGPDAGTETHRAMGAPDRGPQKTERLPAVGGCGHHHHGRGGGGHSAPTPRTMLSQDPSGAAASRQRKSPYPLIPMRDAVRLIFEHTPEARTTLRIPVDESLVGYVLAEDVMAAGDTPSKPSTNVDGYAVRSTDPPGVYKVVTSFPTEPLAQDTIYRINTGAPIPSDLDAVIMVEDTEVVSRHEGDGGDEREVRLLAQVERGENVRKAGSDVRTGEQVLSNRDVVSAVGGEIGTLAFIKKRSVKVFRRPTVAVLSTGNELVNLQDTRTPANSASSFNSIIDTNRPSLISILQQLGYDVLDLGIVDDTMSATTAAMKRGREEADVIITTGGTSMGVGDLLKPCLERELDGTVHFGRVAMKPGKPTTFATLPPHPMAPNQSPRLVFALPGNPASALVTFYVFVLPALRKMDGRVEQDWELPRVPVVLSQSVPLDPRPEYHRVNVRPTSTGLTAFSTGGQRSSRTVSLAGANGLLELPALEKGGREEVPEGETVMCVLIGEMGCAA